MVRNGCVRIAGLACGWLLLLLPALPLPAQTEKVVILAAAEQRPYIDPDLPRQGYAAELVRAAFKKTGYTVELRFYPAARARSLAARGEVDGFLPVTADTGLTENFLLSAPFPGANVGLLMKRGLGVRYSPDAPRRRGETLYALRKYRFGLVRGTALAPEVEAADYLSRDYVATDLQNLDKLERGRIDLMVVDKYAASDLMILYRPHFIGTFEFLNPPLFRSDFHVAFSRLATRHTELKTNFDHGLATLQRSGGLADLLRSNGLRVQDRSADGRETITIGTVNNPDMLVMRSLSAEFEKVNPGVHLDWNILDENTLRTRLMTDLAINDGQFDVMTIGSYETQIWAARSWLTPLGGLPGSYDVDDLVSTVRDSLSYRGTLYALPFYSESSMTYYRTDLFREARVTMPTRPTWADIQQLAAAVHDPQRGIFGVCLRGKPGWGENVALVSTMVNTFGGRWFNEKWMPEIDSAPWRKAVGIYVDLLARFGPPDSNHNSYNENLTLFSQGRCGIWVDATVAAGTLFNPKKSKVASHLGIAPAPAERPDTGAHWLWTWALALPQSSKHQSTARRFIDWATSKAYIRSVARHEGWVAVPPGTRRSTYRSSGYQAAAPFSPHVLDAILSAKEPAQPPRPYTGIQYVAIPEFPAIGHKVGEEISQALTGKITVEQALGDAQTWVARQMEASGYIRDTR